MRFELARAGRVHEVELKDLGPGLHRALWRLKDRDGHVLDSRELELDVRETGPGCYSLLHGHDVHDVRVERSDLRRTVELADGAVAFELLDPLRMASRKGGASAGGPQTVASPIPGRVVRVPVSVGDTVAEGQAVVVVEAMKMANELRSPVAGRVTAVRVAAGSAVEAGTALVVVEPTGDST